MQFLLIDLALTLLALLGYRALTLAAGYRALVVSPEGRTAPQRPLGSTGGEIARPPKPALPKPRPQDTAARRRAPRCGERRSTLHRLINFW